MGLKRAVMLYFKGTGIQLPIDVSRFDSYVVSNESAIIKGLDMGISLEILKRRILEELQEMNKHVYNLCENGTLEYDNEFLERKMGEKNFLKFLAKWSRNVICGLKLGVIKNDDMNGYLFINIRSLP
jgi:hypothetical protein